MSQPNITGQSTMQQVLDAYPSAQRALFRKYHIGGCSSCGYQPDEQLESVGRNHGVEDVQEIIDFLKTSDEADRRLQVSVQAAKALMESGNPPKMLDVRTAEEFEAASIPGSVLFTREVNMEMAEWEKDTPLLFVCHTGARSMDAASFFGGHGFTNVMSLKGGVDAWSREIDPGVARYEIQRDPATRTGVIKPLNESLNNA